VDLPAPLGPISSVIAPRRAWKELVEDHEILVAGAHLSKVMQASWSCMAAISAPR
jgi:hypothetical protein